MTGALRYEWARIRTIASSYWLSGIAIGLTVAISLLLAATIDVGDITEVGVNRTVVTTIVMLSGGGMISVPILAAPFMAVMGAMALGHEYRYGTNKATLSAIPDRLAILAAKLVVLMLWVAAVVVTIVVLDLLIAWLFMSDFSVGSATIRPVLAYLSYCECFAIAGMALSAIFRNQTGAIVAVLVMPYVIEPILYAILAVIDESSDSNIGKATNLLPVSAGRRTLFTPYETWAGFGGNVETWSLAASFAVFWIGTIGLLIAGATLFVKRDA